MTDRAANGRTARGRGRQRERAVAALMRADGWVIGDMSQALGGGDLMASKRHDVREVYLTAEVRLVEVKSTLTPFAHFGPRDRVAMKVVAEQAGATAWLAHWPKNGKLRWWPESEWPA